ncbi:MAG: hypothetical protein Q9162_000381 [Coniocarpon cinnabarinum]
MNDLFNHSHNRQAYLYRELHASILQLVTLASSFSRAAFAHHHAKLTALLEAWFSKLDSEQMKLQLSHAHAAAASDATPKDVGFSSPAIEAPWVMPPQHGFATLSWFDQPAGAFLNVLTPGDKTAVHGRDIVPVPLSPGPSDEETRRAVEELITAVDADHTGADCDLSKVAEFDELGSPLFVDSNTGEKRSNGGYYGWSPRYCSYARGMKKQGSPVMSVDAPEWLKHHRPPAPRPRTPTKNGDSSQRRSNVWINEARQTGERHSAGPPPPPNPWAGSMPRPPPPPPSGPPGPPMGPRGFNAPPRLAGGRGRSW